MSERKISTISKQLSGNKSNDTYESASCQSETDDSDTVSLSEKFSFLGIKSRRLSCNSRHHGESNRAADAVTSKIESGTTNVSRNETSSNVKACANEPFAEATDASNPFSLLMTDSGSPDKNVPKPTEEAIHFGQKVKDKDLEREASSTDGQAFAPWCPHKWRTVVCECKVKQAKRVCTVCYAVLCENQCLEGYIYDTKNCEMTRLPLNTRTPSAPPPLRKLSVDRKGEHLKSFNPYKNETASAQSASQERRWDRTGIFNSFEPSHQQPNSFARPCFSPTASWRDETLLHKQHDGHRANKEITFKHKSAWNAGQDSMNWRTMGYQSSSCASPSSMQSWASPVNDNAVTHDLVDVPYNVLMRVIIFRGKTFYEFTAMTQRNFDFFKRELHMAVQKCKKINRLHYAIGSHCLVKDTQDTQNEWYRGIISRKDGPRSWVYLMDLGIEKEVNDGGIYTTYTTTVFNHPPLAIRLNALNVPYGRARNCDDQFIGLVQNSKFVKIKISHKDTVEAFKFGCTLSVEHNGVWFDAGQLLEKLYIGGQERKLRKCRHQQKSMQRIRTKSIHAASLDKALIRSVQITHVVSPTEFYVTTEKSRQDLITLMEKIDRHPKPLESVQGFKSLQCSCMFLWEGSAATSSSRTRVSIVEAFDDADGIQVVVQKVDSGQVITVPIHQLKTLPGAIQAKVSCAFKCCLPLKETSSCDWLFKSITAILNELQHTQSLVNASVISNENRDTHVVDIFLPPTDASLTAVAVAKGWAERRDYY